MMRFLSFKSEDHGFVMTDFNSTSTLGYSPSLLSRGFGSGKAVAIAKLTAGPATGT